MSQSADGDGSDRTGQTEIESHKRHTT